MFLFYSRTHAVQKRIRFFEVESRLFQSNNLKPIPYRVHKKKRNSEAIQESPFADFRYFVAKTGLLIINEFTRNRLTERAFFR